MYQVGFCLVLCPCPFDGLVMYQPRTPPLAPSACSVLRVNKRANEKLRESTNSSLTLTFYPIIYHLLHSITMDRFTTEELQQCSFYEVGLCANAQGIRNFIRTSTLLPRWEDYLIQIYGCDCNQLWMNINQF